jgi:threonine-phosphate decarboxylase
VTSNYQHLRKAEHGGRGAGEVFANQRPFLDFSVNLNPCAPVLDYHLPKERIIRYPDDDYSELKDVIARHHGRKPEEICVGNGSVEVIRTLCHTYIKPGTTAMIPAHTFSEYALSAKLAGADITHTMGAQADITFFCNPDNPSGILTPRTEIIEKLNRISKYGGIFCVDEAFIDLADPAQQVSDIVHPSLFVLRSLTKSFSMAGVRFGYGIGDASLIAAMEVMRPPWSVNAFAESMAIQAFQRYTELDDARTYISKERERICRRGRELGLTPTPASANFVMFKTGCNASSLTNKMRQLGVLIRDCSSFGLASNIRVAVMKREENDILLEALEKCLH